MLSFHATEGTTSRTQSKTWVSLMSTRECICCVIRLTSLQYNCQPKPDMTHFWFLKIHKRLNDSCTNWFLPPATKLGQGNIFRSVCQEFCSLGGLHHCMLGYTPQEQTPPSAVHEQVHFRAFRAHVSPGFTGLIFDLTSPRHPYPVSLMNTGSAIATIDGLYSYVIGLKSRFCHNFGNYIHK